MTRLLPIAAALLLALPACSGDDGGSSAAPSSQPSSSAGVGPVGGAPSYATTAEVIAALEAAGIACEEPETGEYPGVTDAQSCILGGTEDATILRFATSTERDDYLASKEALASVVVGPDWAVQTVLAPTAEKVGAALGGEVRLGG